jgi:predicted DNA-binding transcriptional regulator AlpA
MVKTRAGEVVGTQLRYINRAELRAIIPVSDMTIWRWERDPAVAFPAPVKFGADGRNFWWLPAIEAWAANGHGLAPATPEENLRLAALQRGRSRPRKS